MNFLNINPKCCKTLIKSALHKVSRKFPRGKLDKLSDYRVRRSDICFALSPFPPCEINNTLKLRFMPIYVVSAAIGRTTVQVGTEQRKHSPARQDSFASSPRFSVFRQLTKNGKLIESITPARQLLLYSFFSLSPRFLFVRGSCGDISPI